MTFKKIMLFFWVGLSVCVAARVLQVAKTIEYSNGFYIDEQKCLGNILLVVIAAVCVVLWFISSRVETTPLNIIEGNWLLSLVSVMVAGTLVVDFYAEKAPYIMPQWQAVTIKAVTLLCIVYFVVLALKGCFNLNISPLFHIIPCVYAIAKIIFTFMSISSLAVISDNILLVAAYCSLMIFFINYGKVHNSVDIGKSFSKCLPSGLCATLLCLTQSVAYFIINLFGEEKYLHINISLMLNVLVFGAFVMAFIVLHFRKKYK